MSIDPSVDVIRRLAVLVIAGIGYTTSLAGAALDFPLGQRQLFLDDHCIDQLTGLHRTMHQPKKRGAVIWPDRPWERTLQTRAMPAWDENEKIFKMWMITSTPVAGVAGTTYAESADGVHWTKPILSQWEYEGSLENNFMNVGPVPLSWPDNAIENVVWDPDDPNPKRRYKGFLDAIGRQPIVGPDGIHWMKLSVPEIPAQDESNLSYDRLTKTFIATLKTGGPHGRAHAIWTSKDFETWTNTGVVFHADALDQKLALTNIQARLADSSLQQPVYNNPADYNADIYNLGIFRYEGLYLGTPAVYHATGIDPAHGNTDGFHLIQLAASRDLQTWARLGDRQPFIGPSPIGQSAYDLMQLLPPSAPVVHGDALWFYYTGIKYRVAPEDPDPDGGAVCLAVLRRDGFISLDAGAQPGSLLTKPVVARGTKLLVNVDATKGALQVTVVDGEGKPIAVSKPVVGNQPRAVVPWKSGEWAELKGREVSLRFTLRQAKFYSFWLDQ